MAALTLSRAARIDILEIIDKLELTAGRAVARKYTEAIDAQLDAIANGPGWEHREASSAETSELSWSTLI